MQVLSLCLDGDYFGAIGRTCARPLPCAHLEHGYRHNISVQLSIRSMANRSGEQYLQQDSRYWSQYKRETDLHLRETRMKIWKNRERRRAKESDSGASKILYTTCHLWSGSRRSLGTDCYYSLVHQFGYFWLLSVSST